jgi:Icc-related predicted phosphoesterase
MVSIFKRKKDNTSTKESVRLLFASDIHASYTVFKKFLNAGKIYKVDGLIIGGDIAGKALVPIIDLGNGKYNVN